MLHALPAPTFMHRLFGRGPARVTRWYAARVREGATREIPGASGSMTLHLREGEAWITHDGDRRDVILQCNENYRVDRGARMTLHALRGDCVLEIEVSG